MQKQCTNGFSENVPCALDYRANQKVARSVKITLKGNQKPSYQNLRSSRFRLSAEVLKNMKSAFLKPFQNFRSLYFAKSKWTCFAFKKTDLSVFSPILQTIPDAALRRSHLYPTSSLWLLCLPPTLHATPVIRPKRSFCKWNLFKSFIHLAKAHSEANPLRLFRTSIVCHSLSAGSSHNWLVHLSIGLLYLREITIHL